MRRRRGKCTHIFFNSEKQSPKADTSQSIVDGPPNDYTNDSLNGRTCASFMVWEEPRPKRELASCCSVEVVKGAGRFRVTICTHARAGGRGGWGLEWW